MSHSLYGYLSRRTTQELEDLLRTYEEAEQNELRTEIIRIIVDILTKRGIM